MIVGSILITLVVIVAFGTGNYLRNVYANYSKYKHIPGVIQLLPVTLFRIPVLAPYIHLGAFKQFPALSKTFRDSPLIRFTIGHQTMIALNSVSALKHVYLKKHKNYEKPRETYQPIKIFGENIVSLPGGEVHQLHRSIVEPIFSEKSLKNVAKVALDSANLLLEKLQRMSGSHEQFTLEVNRDMTDVTIDIIGKTTFGFNFGVFDETDVNAKHKYDPDIHSMSFYDSLHVANTVGMLMKGFFPEWIQQSFVFRSVQTAIKEVDQYLNELVEERLNNGGDRLDLLSLFLESNAVNDNNMSKNEIKSDAFIFLFAGHETSAINLAYLMYEIARSKEVQEKLHEEIDRVIGDKDPTYSDISKFEYLNACIKECLRLHPPVTATVKASTRDDEIDGYHIPKGTVMLIPIYGTHYNDQIYENPKDFVPERFLNTHKQESVTFLPFSYGSRKCVGKTFSYIETAIIIARILQQFSVSFEDGTPEDFVPPERVIITCKIKELNLTLNRRVQASSS